MNRTIRTLLLGGTLWTMQSTAAMAGLLAFYDFNDASNPAVAKDVSGKGNNGDVVEAVYTADKGGHTGAAGDRAMDFGDFNNDAWVDLTTAANGAFNSVVETDAVTVSVWINGGEEQPAPQWNFYAGPFRQLGSHIPWDNSNIYFDVAGTSDSACCNDRISTAIEFETFAGAWNHYAFVKDADVTMIYQNGELLIEGVDMRPMNEITEFFIGAGPEGDRRSYNGLMDDFGIWDNAMTEAEIMDLFKNGPNLGGGGMLGDFNNDKKLDAVDVNALSAAIAGGQNPASFDLNKDNAVNDADLTRWVSGADVRKTWFGDADLNGEFNSGDFVLVFQAGKFETDSAATWEQGDWNADLRFNSGDFIKAFQDGGFEAGPKAAVSAVPEPSSIGWLLVGAAALFARRRS